MKYLKIFEEFDVFGYDVQIKNEKTKLNEKRFKQILLQLKDEGYDFLNKLTNKTKDSTWTTDVFLNPFITMTNDEDNSWVRIYLKPDFSKNKCLMKIEHHKRSEEEKIKREYDKPKLSEEILDFNFIVSPTKLEDYSKNQKAEDNFKNRVISVINDFEKLGYRI